MCGKTNTIMKQTLSNARFFPGCSYASVRSFVNPVGLRDVLCRAPISYHQQASDHAFDERRSHSRVRQ